jgi:transcription elongation factor Elf1
LENKKMEKKTTKTSQGIMEYTRNDNSIEFTCERCNSLKKSKINVKWKTNDGTTKTICNGCYGLLLSKAK